MKWTIKKEDLANIETETLNPEPLYLPEDKVVYKRVDPTFHKNQDIIKVSEHSIVSVTGDSSSGKIEYLLDNNTAVNNDDLISSNAHIFELFDGGQLNLLDGVDNEN